MSKKDFLIPPVQNPPLPWKLEIFLKNFFTNNRGLLQSPVQIGLSNFFVKFANKNFSSVRIFVFRKFMKFLFTLQHQQFTYIILQKVLKCTLFSCIWIVFWFQIPNGGAYTTPPFTLAVGNTH